METGKYLTRHFPPGCRKATLAGTKGGWKGKKARRHMDKATYQLEVAITMEMIKKKELIMIKKL